MENAPLTPKKLQQKVSQLILVGFSALYKVLKVYESLTPRNVFFQDGVQNGRQNALIVRTLKQTTHI